MRRIGWLVALLAWGLALGAAAVAAGAPEDRRAALAEAVGVPEIIDIMRKEGRSYGAELGQDFLPDGGGAGWAAIVERIYDPERMAQAVARGMEAEIGAAHLDPLLAFFRSARGEHIVEQELAAREAFLDPATEELARGAYRGAGEEEKARIALLEAYVEANDLVEYNVAGALTANLRFYRGLAEGGMLDMSEEEMLAQVWEQEEEIRADTAEWLMSYLMMAYAGLSDADIEAYIALSKTPAGQALNRGLFAGFDGMYADLSYALGLAVAQQAQGEEL